MKKQIKFLLITLILIFLPLNTLAINKDYIDVVSDITGENINDNEVILYLFHGQECPHCEEEREWLKTIRNKYDNIRFIYYEVWHNENNSNYLKDIFTKLEVTQNSIPFTIIGEKYFIGFSDSTKVEIENAIRYYLELDEDNKNNNDKNMYIPLLKNIDPKNVSIVLVAIILGFIDGFNPCAMWVLLFLINMLIHLKDKKRRLGLGIIFLLTSDFLTVIISPFQL